MNVYIAFCMLSSGLVIPEFSKWNFCSGCGSLNSSVVLLIILFNRINVQQVEFLLISWLHSGLLHWTSFGKITSRRCHPDASWWTSELADCQWTAWEDSQLVSPLYGMRSTTLLGSQPWRIAIQLPLTRSDYRFEGRQQVEVMDSLADTSPYSVLQKPSTRGHLPRAIR